MPVAQFLSRTPEGVHTAAWSVTQTAVLERRATRPLLLMSVQSPRDYWAIRGYEVRLSPGTSRRSSADSGW